jgi:hypothetical protein
VLVVIGQSFGILSLAVLLALNSHIARQVDDEIRGFVLSKAHVKPLLPSSATDLFQKILSM